MSRKKRITCSSSEEEKEEDDSYNPTTTSSQKKQKQPIDGDSWGSPIDLYKFFDRKYEFYGDMAASRQNHLHERYYTKEDSAFNHNWQKEIQDLHPTIQWHVKPAYVYLNPPYGKKKNKGGHNLVDWIKKVQVEVERGLGVVMVIKSFGGEDYIDQIIGHATEIIHIIGRLSFRHPDTLLPVSGCNFGTTVLIWDPLNRPNDERSSVISYLYRNELSSLYSFDLTHFRKLLPSWAL